MEFYGFHLTTILLEALKQSINEMSLEITKLRVHSHRDKWLISVRKQ